MGLAVATLTVDLAKIELAKLTNELFDLRSQAVTAKVEDTSKFGKLRKDIARLKGEQRRRATAAA